MTKLTQLDFKIDEFLMPFIVNTIRDVRNVKVENMADTLTERKQPASFTPEEIQWMKSTPVRKIHIGEVYLEETESLAFFDLLDEDGEPMLKLSARAGGNGEFRGGIVQEIIKTAQSENPELTLYECFQAHISNVANNDEFIYATRPLINDFFQSHGLINPENPIRNSMSDKLKDRVNAFGQSIFLSLDTLDALCDKNDDLTPEAKEYLEDKLRETFEAKPISQELVDFMNAFKNFQEQLVIVNEKAKSFTADSSAYAAAKELTDALADARNALVDGNITIQEFKNSCEKACEIAENSVLQEHRGWKQVFANIGSVVLSIVTLGIANIISKLATGSFDFSKTNKDSINKVHDMKEKVHDMKEKVRDISTEIDNQEDRNVEQSHRTP